MKHYKVTKNIFPALHWFYLPGSFPRCCSYFGTGSFCDPLKWMQSSNSWSGSQFWGFSACSWKGPFCFRVLELLACVQDRRVLCLLLEVRWDIHPLPFWGGFWDAGKAPVEDFQSSWRWLNQPDNGVFPFLSQVLHCSSSLPDVQVFILFSWRFLCLDSSRPDEKGTREKVLLLSVERFSLSLIFCCRCLCKYHLTPRKQCRNTSLYHLTPRKQCRNTSLYHLTPRKQCRNNLCALPSWCLCLLGSSTQAEVALGLVLWHSHAGGDVFIPAAVPRATAELGSSRSPVWGGQNCPELEFPVLPLSELQESQPVLMEASRLPGALEGRNIPGINRFHHPNSPSNSPFF